MLKFTPCVSVMMSFILVLHFVIAWVEGRGEKDTIQGKSRVSLMG